MLLIFCYNDLLQNLALPHLSTEIIMIKFTFNKLVRDNTPQQQIATGAIVNFEELPKQELIRHLMLKLKEEADEVATANPKEVIEELADVLEVVDAIAETLGITSEQLIAKKQEKFDHRGGFTKGYYIRHLFVKSTDPWLNYFRAQPDKYKEG